MAVMGRTGWLRVGKVGPLPVVVTVLLMQLELPSSVPPPRCALMLLVLVAPPPMLTR